MAKNEVDQLREELAKVQTQMAKLQSSTAPQPFQRYSDAPAGFDNEDRIEAYLKAEDRPLMLFSEDRCFQITLQYGAQVVDPATHQARSMPDLILKFTPYFGPGSEIPDPTDPKARKYRWGYADLAQNTDVRAGRITAEKLLELIVATDAWRDVRVFDDTEAKARIRADYEISRARAAEEARAAKIRASRPVGAQKGGGMALLPGNLLT